jgi:hypothetical protein
LLLRGFGVRSGIRATAGDRYVLMARSTIPRAIKNIGRLFNLSAKGKKAIHMTAINVPKMIKGVRLPSLVSTLSDKAPNKGSIIRASTLSMAIIAPVKVSPTPKVFFSISGMILSYSCQKELIDKNARPIKKVRL